MPAGGTKHRHKPLLSSHLHAGPHLLPSHQAGSMPPPGYLLPKHAQHSTKSWQLPPAPLKVSRDAYNRSGGGGERTHPDSHRQDTRSSTASKIPAQIYTNTCNCFLLHTPPPARRHEVFLPEEANVGHLRFQSRRDQNTEILTARLLRWN